MKTKLLCIIFIMMLLSPVSYGATVVGGAGIDITQAGGAGTAMTWLWDPTEVVGSFTLGDGSTDTIVLTVNRSTGTDPTITFNDGSIGLQALTVAGDIGVTGTRVTKGWFTDLEITNAIAGSVTGNAATATNVAAGATGQLMYQSQSQQSHW